MSAIKSCNVSTRQHRLCKSKKLIFEPIIGCKHPIIALGATPIGTAGHAPDRKNQKVKNIFCGTKIMIKPKETLSLYSNKYNLAIAPGATPIRTADRAPDD
jgi:hypothetical protein